MINCCTARTASLCINFNRNEHTKYFAQNNISAYRLFWSIICAWKIDQEHNTPGEIVQSVFLLLYFFVKFFFLFFFYLFLSRPFLLILLLFALQRLSIEWVITNIQLALCRLWITSVFILNKISTIFACNLKNQEKKLIPCSPVERFCATERLTKNSRLYDVMSRASRSSIKQVTCTIHTNMSLLHSYQTYVCVYAEVTQYCCTHKLLRRCSHSWYFSLPHGVCVLVSVCVYENCTLYMVFVAPNTPSIIRTATVFI